MNSVLVNPSICSLICFFHIIKSTYYLELFYRPAFQCLFTLCVFERRQFIIEGNSQACLVIHHDQNELQNNKLNKILLFNLLFCSSFLARDCNACFSQIFETRTFGYLSDEQESLFMTLRTFDSFCSSCTNFVTLNSGILLTVVTAYRLNQLGFEFQNKNSRPWKSLKIAVSAESSWNLKLISSNIDSRVPYATGRNIATHNSKKQVKTSIVRIDFAVRGVLEKWKVCPFQSPWKVL